MKRSPFPYAVALLFPLFVFQPTIPGIAGENEQSSPILQVGRSVIALSTDDTTKLQEKEERFREATEAYEREMEAQTRKEREAEEQKESQKELEQVRSDPKQWRFMIWSVQMMLGQFGYGTGPFDGKLDERTRRALKDYQTYNKLPPTGEIDLNIFMKLHKDQEALVDITSVILPRYSFSDHFWDDYFFAEGTGTIIGSQQAYPLQTTRIECDHRRMECLEVIAELQTWGSSLLSVYLERHKIAQCDEHEITTKPNDKLCVRYTLRVSRSQKAVTGVRAPIIGKVDCSGVEQRDLQLRLEAGEKVLGELRKKRREAWSRILRMDQSLLKDIGGF